MRAWGRSSCTWRVDSGATRVVQKEGCTINKVRCAVIGAGWWGTTAHVPALYHHPQAELVAVQHHDPAKAERIAHDFKVPHGLTTAEEILELDGLQAVVVSSTPHLHHLQAKSALQRGLHVLVEKPMTHSAAEAEELVELAAEKNVQLIVGATFHYNRHVLEAKRLLQSGALGDIHLMCILFMDEILGLYQGLSWKEFAGNHPDPEVEAEPYIQPGRTSYSDPKISGGGQIYAQVSHVAALAPFLTGDQPVAVNGLLNNADAAVDVYDALSFKLQRGTIVSLASGGRIGNAPRHLDVRIYGTRGVIEMELLAGTMQHWDHAGELTTYPPLKTDEELYPRFSPARNLVDVVLGRAANGSPGDVGLSTMQIIEQACRSSQRV